MGRSDFFLDEISAHVVLSITRNGAHMKLECVFGIPTVLVKATSLATVSARTPASRRSLSIRKGHRS
ncbi:hypothetical protein HPB48_001226 [Haemaphysalis longicornis]|uniref:Uncharacterized protein n=1 Tax=Haemaphysalis longicornis TaxID=44386 RepID=A0A9J6FI34_HAELO|nr:hypothetical protein HPB48_001226 [Haemaphysalis longicornis]